MNRPHPDAVPQPHPCWMRYIEALEAQAPQVGGNHAPQTQAEAIAAQTAQMVALVHILKAVAVINSAANVYSFAAQEHINEAWRLLT